MSAWSAVSASPLPGSDGGAARAGVYWRRPDGNGHDGLRHIIISRQGEGVGTGLLKGDALGCRHHVGNRLPGSRSVRRTAI